MLRERIITALALVAALLVALFLLPQPIAALALAALVLGGAWEWAGFLGLEKGEKSRLLYVCAIAAVMALLWWISASEGAFSILLWMSLAWWALALVWIVRYPTAIPRPAIAVCGALVLVPAWVALVRIHLSPQGAQWLIFVFFVVWAADIGAYIVGRLAGRTRLAPQVSPGKTWEGVLGGLSAATLAAFAGAHWFDLDAVLFVPLCIAVAMISIVGDLTVSMFKRNAGLKDSSQLLPGHGGILDRIDSITAAVPLFVLGLASIRALA